MFLEETKTPLKTKTLNGHTFVADSYTNFESSTLNYGVGVHLGQSKYFSYRMSLRFWHSHPNLNSIIYTTFEETPNPSVTKELKHLYKGNGHYMRSEWLETVNRNNRKEICHPGDICFIENFTEKRSELKNELIERMQFIRDIYTENKVFVWEQYPLYVAMEAITSGISKTLHHNMGGKK